MKQNNYTKISAYSFNTICNKNVPPPPGPIAHSRTAATPCTPAGPAKSPGRGGGCGGGGRRNAWPRIQTYNWGGNARCAHVRWCRTQAVPHTYCVQCSKKYACVCMHAMDKGGRGGGNHLPLAVGWAKSAAIISSPYHSSNTKRVGGEEAAM